MKHTAYEVLIIESHLDTFGHVNNATYLTLFEEARWQFITERDYGLDEIIRSGKGPIILEAHVKYQKELRLRQKIRIETQCLSYRKKIGQLKQVMWNESNESCAEAVFVFGLFDTHARKLIAPTVEWLRAIDFTEGFTS